MKEILNKMKEVSVFANLEVDYGSPMASSQFASKKRALEELNLLKIEYTNRLIQEVVAIAVTGDQSNNFSEIASNSGLITVNLDKPLQEVLRSINPDIYLNQSLSLDLSIMISSILQEMANSSGIQVNNIDLEQVPLGLPIESQDQFVDLFMQLTLNSDPNLCLALGMVEVAKTALENEFGKKSGVLPVVFVTNSQLVLNTMTKNTAVKRTITVLAGQGTSNSLEYSLEKVDENSVEETLKAIKKSLKEK